jgi:hypothetical protein
MKRGDFVDIYTDPLTCQVLEGRARLVVFIDHCPDGLDMWEVEFTGEFSTVIRFLKLT